MSYHISIESGTVKLLPSLDSSLSAAVSTSGLGWLPSPDGSSLSSVESADRPDPITDLRRVLDMLRESGVQASGILTWLGEDGVRGRALVEDGTVTVEEDEEEELAPSEVARIIAQVAGAAEAGRIKAMEMMVAFDVRSPAAIAALSQALTDESVQVRMHAAETLGFFGSAAASAIPALEAALHDSHIWVQAAAAGALGELGPLAASALPALRELQKSPHYGPSGRAREAIAKIGGG